MHFNKTAVHFMTFIELKDLLSDLSFEDEKEVKVFVPGSFAASVDILLNHSLNDQPYLELKFTNVHPINQNT